MNTAKSWTKQSRRLNGKKTMETINVIELNELQPLDA